MCKLNVVEIPDVSGSKHAVIVSRFQVRSETLPLIGGEDLVWQSLQCQCML